MAGIRDVGRNAIASIREYLKIALPDVIIVA
jgi:hypothetical protein